MSCGCGNFTTSRSRDFLVIQQQLAAHQKDCEKVLDETTDFTELNNNSIEVEL